MLTALRSIEKIYIFEYLHYLISAVSTRFPSILVQLQLYMLHVGPHIVSAGFDDDQFGHPH